MTDIKLYGYATSPYVRKVGCFLYYKKLEFEHVAINPLEAEERLSFIGGTQVPVLVIDGEARRESSELAFWLDEKFSERPLCPAAHRETILKLDDWISNTFLTSIFRAALDGEMTLQKRYRFWRLAALVSAGSPMPSKICHMWPDFVSTAPFIQEMRKHVNMDESAGEMAARIGMELAAHIGDGSYMGGLSEPSMLDLAVLPQLVFGVLGGLEDGLTAARHPVIKAWIERMMAHLPANPTLVEDYMVVKSVSDALAEV